MVRTKWSSKQLVKKAKPAPKLNSDGKPRKRHKWKSGTVARREIRRYQRGKLATRMLVPTASLDKVIREVLQEQQSTVSQISPQAREALRVSSEEYLTGLFREATDVAKLRKAETINIADFQYAVKQSRQIETVMRNAA